MVEVALHMRSRITFVSNARYFLHNATTVRTATGNRNTMNCLTEVLLIIFAQEQMDTVADVSLIILLLPQLLPTTTTTTTITTTITTTTTTTDVAVLKRDCLVSISNTIV